MSGQGNHGNQRPGLPTGLVKGLAVTARTMLRPTHTTEYPDVEPDLPPRTRGVIALVEENCTSCMLCARECPDWCIYIDSHKETIPAAPGSKGRDRQRNVLDRFAIDFSLCMYCSICVEVCPFDALYWSPQFQYAEFDLHDLLHEKERLAQWRDTVPPPPALDEHAVTSKEVTAALAKAPVEVEPTRAALPAPMTLPMTLPPTAQLPIAQLPTADAPTTQLPTAQLPEAPDDDQLSATTLPMALPPRAELPPVSPSDDDA